MTRFKLTIEYDGGPFYGWQRQDNVPSVQGAIERAAAHLDQREMTIQGAGRTDAGVHALGQVAHVDMVRDIFPDKLRDALNHHLRPDPVAVLAAEIVDEEFNARFSAIGRKYLYRIMPRRAPLTLDKGKVWRMPRKMDAAAMHEAAQFLIGQHDFSTFRDSQCQAKSPIKTLDRLDVSMVGDEIHVWAEARSFLHSQVRSIVGSLAQVGVGTWSLRHMQQALEACDRTACGPVAPPDGLYLVAVIYPE